MDNMFTSLTNVTLSVLQYISSSEFTSQASQWLQYLSVRRILAMSDRDCRATKRFLPLVAAGGPRLRGEEPGETQTREEKTLPCL